MSDQTYSPATSADTPGPLTFERTWELIDEFCEIYPVAYAIDYRVKATQEELYGPTATRANVGRIFGGYIPATSGDRQRSPSYRGRCDLAYSSFRDETELRQTLVHEVLGHFGLNTLERSEKRVLLESIQQSRHLSGLDALWNSTANRYADSPDLLVAEELYCSLVEAHTVQIFTAVNRPAILDKLVQDGPQLLRPEDLKSIADHVATGLHDESRDQVIFPADRRAQFSRSNDLPKPLSLERAKELVHEFCKTYPVAYAIKFKIRATQEELYGPTATRENIGTVFGGYVPATATDRAVSPVYRGRCDLAYSSFRDEEDFRRCLQHEISGHFGLNTCTEAEKRALLESIERSRNAPGIKEIWDQASYDYAGEPDSKIAEEVFSIVAEDQFSGHPRLVASPDILVRLREDGPQIIGPDDLQDIAAHIATGLQERTRDQVIFPADRRAQFSRTAPDKTDKTPFHEVVASELIRQIEAGTAPWQKPWNAEGGLGGMPFNPTTGKRYKGINAIHLLAQGHTDPRWLTYKQAASLGAQVQKGERGTAIQYWKFEDTRNKIDANGKPVLGPDGAPVQERFKLENPRVFYATVFNAAQIEGLAPYVTPALGWEPVERAQQMLANSGASIAHQAMDRAYYSPVRDEIHLPLREQFATAGAYYATALHELGHWSGHESRLKRDLSHAFGSEGYAREELRAEIASMILCAELGLPHDPGQHASYVASWVSVLKKDPLEIFRAAADAEKIHTLAMSFAPALTQQTGQAVGHASGVSPAAEMPQSVPARQDQAENRDSSPSPAIAAAKVNTMSLQTLSADDVRDALSYISPNMPRDDWARIAMAIKSEFPTEIGLELFDQWSSIGEGYERSAVVSTWRSIRAEGPVKVGTLLKLALDNGYKPRQENAWRAAPTPRLDAAAQAAQVAAAAQEQQERLSQQQNAAAQAQQLWDDAKPGDHTNTIAAYLQRKGVGSHGTRTLDNGTLLVPLVDEQGALWNVQRILPSPLDNGVDKLFLKGGRKSGLFHVIGAIPERPEVPAAPILFAEGYATAASLHEATGWPTVVCLDAGNLIKVTNQFRKRLPQALMVVAGDDDQQTMATKGVNPGREKASMAAEQTQAVLALPQGLALEHSDFNDLVAQLGVANGHAQIRTSLHQALSEYVQNAMPSDAPQALQQQALQAINALQDMGLDMQTPTAPEATVLTDSAADEMSVGGAALSNAPSKVSAQVHTATGSTPESEDQHFVAPDPDAHGDEGAVEDSLTVQPGVPAAAKLEPEQSQPAQSLSQDKAVTHTDPNNELNVQGLQVKRAREAEQVKQEMAAASAGFAQAVASESTREPNLGMNSVSSGMLTQDPASKPSQDSALTQELRVVRDRLSSEYQFDGVSKYFFRQGTKPDLAFEDQGSKFDTPHHTPEVVASIAQLAHAKGWQEMYLTGTPEFRREMWLQASLLNMKVIGYEPEPIDHVRLHERRQVLAKDQSRVNANEQSNSVASVVAPDLQASVQTAAIDSSETADAVKAASAPALLSSVAAKQLDAQLREVLIDHGAADPHATERTLDKLYALVKSPRVYLGKVLEHGAAPYRFDPKEQSSYFIKLQTQTGQQTVWGVDLPRALAEVEKSGQRAVGQDILLAFQGMQKVKSLVPQKGEAGRPAGESWQLVDRNTWLAQPVMDIYAQSQQELAKMPADARAKVQSNRQMPTAQTSGLSPAGAAPSTPEQTMHPLRVPQERLRAALARMGTDPLQAEFTVTSLQSLFGSPKFHVGELLEHGPAALKFTEGQPPSYYLKLATEQGHVMLWSSDFERAMNRHPVQLGQTIVAAYRGIELITGGDGRAQPRNDWLVAPLKTLHEEAQQGVIQRMTNAQVMPAAVAPAQSASDEQKSLYVLREAMRQAGIPQEFAQAALKDAEQMLGVSQHSSAHGHPSSLAARAVGHARTDKPASPTLHALPSATVSRKVGPSL